MTEYQYFEDTESFFINKRGDVNAYTHEKISLVFLSVIMFLILLSCKHDVTEPTLAGQPGNPRFNLVFDNADNVDLDLHVTDPLGNTIWYGNKQSPTGGNLDVDCKCSSCPNGPNENVFFPINGSSPNGTYKFWIEYYDYCGSDPNATSNFTLRVAVNSTVKQTYTGTLSSNNYKSQVYTYVK